MRNTILKCGIAVCVIVFLFSLFKLYQIHNEYKKGEDLYKTVTDQTVTASEAPHSFSPSEIKIDFEALTAMNPEVVGFIYCENTPIKYPVLCTDNNSYYLNHLMDNTYNSSGSIFMDFRNNKMFNDKNTIIYGHNMKNGSMFASILNYKNQDYYNQHPYIYLFTPSQNYRIEIFSSYITDFTYDFYQVNLKDETEYKEYLNGINLKSDFLSNVTVTSQDNIVTLSTCSNDYLGTRYVVHGKLTKINQ